MALSPLVVRVTASNPGMMTGPGTNTYLVGRSEVVVVDPGPDDPVHIERLVELGAGRIDTVVVTHTHRDHAPGAAALAARSGADVLGFAPRDGFVPSHEVGDGFVLRRRDATLRAVHTPGHASDHLCWLLEDEAMLFSGDHVMQGSTVVIAPPDGDMAAYLDSLRRLLTLEPALASIAPGHGAVIDDPSSVVQAVIEHRLLREDAVETALRRAGRATVDELLPEVYPDVGVELLPVARFSLWAHLRKLGDDGRASSEDRAALSALWTSG